MNKKMGNKKRGLLLVLCCCMCGTAYLVRKGAFPSAMEFLTGALLGLTLTLIIMALLPEAARQKLKRWKGRWNVRG